MIGELWGNRLRFQGEGQEGACLTQVGSKAKEAIVSSGKTEGEPGEQSIDIELLKPVFHGRIEFRKSSNLSQLILRIEGRFPFTEGKLDELIGSRFMND